MNNTELRGQVSNKSNGAPVKQRAESHNFNRSSGGKGNSFDLGSKPSGQNSLEGDIEYQYIQSQNMKVTQKGK